jgi:hypothetical protein
VNCKPPDGGSILSSAAEVSAGQRGPSSQAGARKARFSCWELKTDGFCRHLFTRGRARDSEVSSDPQLGSRPEIGPQSVEETTEPLFPLLAPVTQERINHVGIFRREVRWRPNSPHEFCPPDLVMWLGRPQQDPLALWPAPVIAVRHARAAGGLSDRQDRPGRRDPRARAVRSGIAP